MDPLVVLLAGLVVALAAALLLTALRRGGPHPEPPVDTAQVLAGALAELRRQASAERDAAVTAALQQAAVLHREQLGAALQAGQHSLDARLAAGQHELAAQMSTGQHELGAKKDLIDHRLDQVASSMKAELGRVAELVRHLGEVTTQRFGEVNAALTAHAETTSVLATTTQGLREALSNPKARGQWGERMAEDVLRLAGFVENVNYRRQTKLDEGDGIPDFTFDLPKGQALHLDVKFPLSAYLRYLDAASDAERSAHRDAFLRDVRLRVRELARRDYARAGDRSSLDYVLLFLPNEGVSGFIHENDGALIDDALRQKVVLCSPLTLFAMLGVIRQAHDAFMVERTSDQILGLLGSFDLQWGKFSGAIDTLGKRIESVQRGFDELNGPRRRQLERPLMRLEALRAERGIVVEGAPALATDDDADAETEGELFTLGRRRGELGA